MNCRDIDRALVESRLTAPLSGVADHVSGCKGCRELVHTLGARFLEFNLREPRTAR